MQVRSLAATVCPVMALFLAGTFVAAAGSLTAIAAPGLQGVTLTFLIQPDGGVRDFDVRGTDFLFDGAHYAYLSDFETPMHPNTFLSPTDLAISQALYSGLNVSAVSFSSDFQQVFVPSFTTLVGDSPLIPRVTDPVLLALLSGSGIGRYDFAFSAVTPLEFGFERVSYTLTSIEVAQIASVPEPSTLAFMLIGLAGCACIRCRRDRHNC